MPFRALLIEPSGEQAVDATRATDKEWQGFAEAYVAGQDHRTDRLVLPCCRARAVLRDGNERVRHFAHAPGTLRQCPVPDKRSAYVRWIVAEVAGQLRAAAWTVTLDELIDDRFVDVIGSPPESALRRHDRTRRQRT